MSNPIARQTRSRAGKRSYTRTKRPRGRYFTAEAANGSSDIAFDATLRAASLHQRRRGRKKGIKIEKHDIQKKVRMSRIAHLIIFVVDASWSMVAKNRMEAVKGAIMLMLQEAYRKRDKVSLIVFRKNAATIMLPPTNSVQLAQRVMKQLPVGGKTPLSAGLFTALKVAKQGLRLSNEIMPLLIILTDGKGNASMGQLPPQAEEHLIARQIGEQHISSTIIDIEESQTLQQEMEVLARYLKADVYHLQRFESDTIAQAVKLALYTG